MDLSDYREITAPRPLSQEFIDSQDMSAPSELITVCEVAREIYRVASTIPTPEGRRIMELAKLAHAMQKRMDVKLREYKRNYDEGWFHKKKRGRVHELEIEE